MPPDPPDDDDAILLREYCADRAEPAFRALVERHLPAVWSAARRMVNGDAALAEDIAQEVFAHLAVYAKKLPPRVVLGGWLHRHTCFTAAKAVRAASRRRAREQQAAAMNAPDANPWPDIAPHLDAALNALSATDRDAVVLRFFEKRDFRSIATALGTTEDAARMKTARAVEKLRGILGKRSALLTVALLTALLGEKSIATPPAQAAARITATSLARAATLPALSGIAAILARLRTLRTTLIAGAVLCAAGFAVWQWNDWFNHPDKAPRPQASASAAKGKAAVTTLRAMHIMDVTVHFILVPEGEAASIMENRWTSDEDTALLESLLKKTGPASSGVQLARTLTGTCVSGNRIKLEEVKDFPYPSGFDPGEKGLITPDEFTSRNVGSIAQLELTVAVDGPNCDVNLSTEHHFAEPGIHHFPTTLATPEDTSLPGARLPEFRRVKANDQLMMDPGKSQLAQCSQLPRLPGTPAEAPDQRLFTFITVNPAPQP